MKNDKKKSDKLAALNLLHQILVYTFLFLQGSTRSNTSCRERSRRTSEPRGIWLWSSPLGHALQFGLVNMPVLHVIAANAGSAGEQRHSSLSLRSRLPRQLHDPEENFKMPPPHAVAQEGKIRAESVGLML